MFNADAETAKAVIIGAFIFGQWFVFGLFVGDVAIWMRVLQALIAAVGIDMRIFGKFCSASPDGDIGYASRLRL